MRTLTLALKGEYFDAIKAGTKPEEFRQVTPYWRRRLEGQRFDRIELTRGYPKRADDYAPSVEFVTHCQRSPRTVAALVALLGAMRLDNEERPLPGQLTDCD